MEIDCLERNDMFKFKITPDRHNARQNLNYCVLLDPPHFSLPSTFKGSRQRERRGVANVSNGPNFSWTPAIEVLFSINSAVVFDFMYFHFRPSKANSIGNVPTNRQNAAKRVQEIC
jgi:hypothetical protein